MSLLNKDLDKSGVEGRQNKLGVIFITDNNGRGTGNSAYNFYMLKKST